MLFSYLEYAPVSILSALPVAMEIRLLLDCAPWTGNRLLTHQKTNYCLTHSRMRTGIIAPRAFQLHLLHPFLTCHFLRRLSV
jgi:hypothetical protein